MEEPGQPACRCFRAGDQQCDEFVVDLLVGHGVAAVGVLGLQEHRQQVRLLGGEAGAPGADEVVDGPAQSVVRGREAAVAKSGELLPKAGRIDGPVVHAAEHDGHVVADVRGNGLVECGREQCGGDDGQGEFNHLLGDVDDLSGLPGGDSFVGQPRHGSRVVIDLPVMEGRLHQASLAEVEGPFGGGEALTEVVAELLEGAALREVAGVGDHHLVDDLRSGEDVGRCGAQVDGNDLVVRGEGIEEFQGAPPHFECVADQRKASGSGGRGRGVSGGGHMCLPWAPGPCLPGDRVVLLGTLWTGDAGAGVRDTPGTTRPATSPQVEQCMPHGG